MHYVLLCLPLTLTTPLDRKYLIQEKDLSEYKIARDVQNYFGSDFPLPLLFLSCRSGELAVHPPSHSPSSANKLLQIAHLVLISDMRL